MKSFEQRLSSGRDPVRLLGRRLLMVLLLILVALVGKGVWSLSGKQQEAKANLQEAQARLSDLQRREAELESKIAALKTDRGLEAELRQQYELGKEGEGLIVIVDDPEPKAAPKAAFPSVEWFKQLLGR